MRRDDQPDSGQLLLQTLQNSFQLAQYDTKSVLAGLVVSFGSVAVMFVAFCLLRPRHNLIYAPRARYSDPAAKPESLGHSLLAWIPRVVKITEQELVDKLGLDAALCIRFSRMLRNMFAVLSLVGCGIAIPINVVYNLRSAQHQVTAADVLMLTTPYYLTGTPLAAHIALAYAFNGVVFFFVWKNYAQVIATRQRYFASPQYQDSLFARTILFSEIPKSSLSESALVKLLDSLPVSRPIQQVTLGRNVKNLTKMLDDYNATVYRLERVLAKYLRNPDRIPSKRPLCKPWPEDKHLYAESRVDAIEYLLNRMHRLTQQIDAARQAVDSRSRLPYGMVSYNSVQDANTVAQYLGSASRKLALRTHLAPRPEDLIWSNIVLSKLERANKEWWGNVLYAGIVVLWIVPNAFIGCFASQLSRIGVLWPQFNVLVYGHPTLFVIIQGVFAPVLTTAIFLVLPVIMRRISQWQGKVTKSQRERTVMKKLYLFFCFNNFFVFTLMSVVWFMATEIVSLARQTSHESAWDLLHQLTARTATAIITASSFWVMYTVRAYIGAWFDLLQVLTLLADTFRRYVLSPTPRQLMLATAPQPFAYAAYYNWLLFYVTIALAFTSLQPLLLPVLALYLTMDTVLRKYQFMYMFVTKTESDGQFWPLIINCVLIATALGNVLVTIVVGTQGSWHFAVAAAPLLATVVGFKIALARKFNQKYRYNVADDFGHDFDQELTAKAPMSSSQSILEQRYVNPAISKRLMLPMVHARAQSALANVIATTTLGEGQVFDYDSSAFLPRTLKDKLGRRTQMGDNQFEIVQSNELDYDHYCDIAKDDATLVAAPIELEARPIYYPSKHSSPVNGMPSPYVAPNPYSIRTSPSQLSLHSNDTGYNWLGQTNASVDSVHVVRDDDRANLLG